MDMLRGDGAFSFSSSTLCMLEPLVSISSTKSARIAWSGRRGRETCSCEALIDDQQQETRCNDGDWVGARWPLTANLSCLLGHDGGMTTEEDNVPWAMFNHQTAFLNAIMDRAYIGEDAYFMSKSGRRKIPLNKNTHLKQSKWLVMNKCKNKIKKDDCHRGYQDYWFWGATS